MTDTNSIWYLENLDLTAILCPTKLASGSLDDHKQKTFNKGEYIYLPKEDADKIYFLMEGQAKIGTIGEGGKEITKTILSQGEVFGELALTGQTKRRDFALAMEKTTLCIISVAQMKGLMREYNSLQAFFMKIMGDRVIQMEERLESLVFRDSRTRIVEYVWTLAKKKGQRIGYETLIKKMLTHEEIAKLTATSRQTVTTVLNELRSKNIITFNRKRILVRDMALLAKEGDFPA